MNNNNSNCGTSRTYDPNKVMGAELVKSRNLNQEAEQEEPNNEVCDEVCDEACDEACDEIYYEDDCESVSECEN